MSSYREVVSRICARWPALLMLKVLIATGVGLGCVITANGTDVAGHNFGVSYGVTLMAPEIVYFQIGGNDGQSSFTQLVVWAANG